MYMYTYKPEYEILLLIALLNNEGSDEHAQENRLTNAITAQIHKVWM